MVPSALLNAIAGRALDGVRTFERTGPVDGSVEDPRTISGRLSARARWVTVSDLIGNNGVVFLLDC
jgi:hypothetical protein